MSLENIFPTPVLTETEMDSIAAKLDDPLIKKYFRLMAVNDASDFLALSAIRTPEFGMIQARAVLQGRLEVISALLSIQAASLQQS